MLDKRMSDSSWKNISATFCICGQNFGQATPATYGTMEAPAKENMAYDADNDEYTCYGGRKLPYKRTKKKKSSNGYISTVRVYECKDCSGCAYRGKCTKSQVWNRRIEVNVRLDELKKEARENLLSEVGLALRKRRCIEPEYVFGRVKWCWGFRRFLLRGMEKVKVEWGLLCMAHNISRLAIIWGA
ncbi:MAG: transposase [Eubacteriales bacterium]